MRTALSGLTTRGRSFLASGLASMACSYFIVGAALLRIGVLLAVVPVASALLVSRARYHVRCQRSVAPERVPCGHEARVWLQLDNVSRVPTGVLLIEDRLPYVLGARPRFVLDRVGGAGRRVVTYRIRSDLRGRFVLGPLSLRLTDPFGMCEIDRSFSAQSTLVVTPVVHALPRLPLSGDWTGAGDGRGAAAATGEDDVGVREYRHGDDVRRVHWRASAHRGELMVRREEQPLRRQAAVVLDTRADGHAGEGPASTFEWAVSAAASVALHLHREGYQVRLHGHDGTDLLLPGLSRTGTAFEGTVLDSMAAVAVGSAAAGGGGGNGPAGPPAGAGGLVVAVLGDAAYVDPAVVGAFRRGESTAVAFVLDTTSWRPAPEPEAQRRRQVALDGLRRAGWRVVPVTNAAPLPVWWKGIVGRAPEGSAAGGAAPAPGRGAPVGAGAPWPVRDGRQASHTGTAPGRPQGWTAPAGSAAAGAPSGPWMPPGVGGER